jgi:hypothetical protein
VLALSTGIIAILTNNTLLLAYRWPTATHCERFLCHKLRDAFESQLCARRLRRRCSFNDLVSGQQKRCCFFHFGLNHTIFEERFFRRSAKQLHGSTQECASLFKNRAPHSATLFLFIKSTRHAQLKSMNVSRGVVILILE